MAGEDLTSSELAAPPLLPLAVEELEAGLDDLEAALTAGAVGLGLDRWFWGEGVSLLALARLARQRDGGDHPVVVAHIDPHTRRHPVLEHVNNLAPGAALAELLRTREHPARMELLVAGLDWYASAPEATRAPNGALEHWPGGVWADTVYMAGEFLLRAGEVLRREDLVAQARDQWLAHAEVLQDDASGLFAHGTHQGERIPCHWGRANAWIALAGADLVAAGADATGEIAERLTRQLTALASHQPEHGVWDVLVDGQPETRGVLETSAAAGIGAAALRFAALDPAGRTAIRAMGELAVRGALAYVEGEHLTRVSAGTVLQLIPFGYSVIRDDRPQPWGQGLGLEAIAAWRETADDPGAVTRPSRGTPGDTARHETTREQELT
ncbi:MAG: glycoside hydrolase family 88 protein [Salana multivorans]|uniref:glycoside hydrolase family 88 protein n=1 Tax=Salana multivorans TaxID=120377 RepID=UPI000A766A89|nr:glycoside hydrolase family 88 protein [Salana multivorans]MBN8883364.1 glycoside hydrolase family 88 protein [Salana multivorans]